MSNIIKSTKNQNIILYEFKETFCDTEDSKDTKGNDETKRNEEEGLFAEDDTKRVEMLKEVQDKAEGILKKALEEAEEIRKRAYEEGHQTGFTAGYEEGLKEAYQTQEEKLKEEISTWQNELKTIADDMKYAKDLYMEQYMDDLKAITITIAEKIIQTSLKSSGEIIKRMIVSATDKLKKTEWVKIYIDRFGYEKLLEVDSLLAAELSYLSDNIKIIVMDKEERGSCIVEVPEEIIDLSVSTQLENIKDIINNARLQ